MLDGRWRLGAPIARGRFSVVHAGEGVTSGRGVAVKLHAPRWLEDPAARQRFLREARAFEALVHPRLVRVLGAGEHAGSVYLVMERIDGRPLADVITERRVLPVADVLRVAIDVLDALDLYHRTGRIHRDVKPGNVMIDRDGHGVLIDLGLLGAADPLFAASGIVEGTPEFMAPEQSRGMHLADARSDLYGLGATMLAALVGAPPFSGDTPSALFRAHHEEPPPRASRLVGAVPEAVDRLIERALAKKPRRRFQSAAEMRDAIRALRLA